MSALALLDMPCRSRAAIEFRVGKVVEDLQTSQRIGLVLAAIMFVCFTLSAIALP